MIVSGARSMTEGAASYTQCSPRALCMSELTCVCMTTKNNSWHGPIRFASIGCRLAVNKGS